MSSPSPVLYCKQGRETIGRLSQLLGNAMPASGYIQDAGRYVAYKYDKNNAPTLPGKPDLKK